MNSNRKFEGKPHPRARSNFISAVLIGWTLSVFMKGFARDLEKTDLYEPLEEHKSDFLGSKLERIWENVVKKSKRKKEPSLLYALIKCFGPQIILSNIIMAISEFAFRMTQPMFLGRLIQYFSEPGTVSRDDALVSAGCIVLCSAIGVLLRQPCMLALNHVGMKMRISLCSILYRKVLRLSVTAVGETTVGQAVNLLSNDVSRFEYCLMDAIYLWIGPLEALAVTYFMWQAIGISAFIGFATILLFIPLEVFLGKRFSTLRLRTALRTDERVRLMNEIICGMQIIKMYAWEKPFTHLVALARRFEIKSVRSAALLYGYMLAFEMFGSRLALFTSLVSYTLLENNITAKKVFVVAAYCNILKVLMTDFLPRSVAQLGEAYTSVLRIQKFLLCDEVILQPHLKKINYTVHNNQNGSQSKITKEGKGGGEISRVISTAINIANADAKWVPQSVEYTLNGINLEVNPGKVVAIIGPVGAGKTSLLHAILGELPLENGSVTVNGTVSYASQGPWVFAGSVRQNILFGQSMDRERYQRVVSACALERDFSLMPNGDKTFVSERGVTLSGGQRARINLARAVYREADIYLLDDPLSAVDTHVGRQLFDNCICDFLKSKTCILITHQLQYLQTVDLIVVLNNGSIETMGTFAELQSLGLDFTKHLKQEGAVEEMESEPHGRVFQLSECSQMSLNEQESLYYDERQSRGKVRSSVYAAYWSAAGHWCIVVSVLIIFIMSQTVVATGDYWLSFWTRLEEERIDLPTASDNSSRYVVNTSVSINELDTVGNITSSSNIRNNTDMWILSTGTCIAVYSGFLITVIMLSLTSAYLFISICMCASVRLHNTVMNSITHATMRFFNTNPSGQILNRFSKDVGIVDDLLPRTFIDCLQIGLVFFSVVILVAIVNYWMLIPTALMALIFYLLRLFYIGTSRSLRRLEGITRSPVYSHLSASLHGLITIRAYHAETMLMKEFDNHQDVHSSASYLSMATNRAFGLWLDMTCVMYITFVSFGFLFVDDIFGGDVGLAVTQAIGLTMAMQWGIRQSAELENEMTSVERIIEYSNIQKEAPLESLPNKKPCEDWPSKGEIIFNGVFLKYSENDPAVLKNINFTISPGTKVGIVGRTGAGKSSLITAIFRLEELCEGTIYIDKIDISDIGLHDLRTKISIIPQEPMLFSGSLRDNLDPFQQYSDADLWLALTEVELKQIVDELPAGLSHRVLEGGSNFSVGQRQLLCLARAIIRNNKILVLDEATANVDPQTDELIQETIRRKFSDCTVLTIAHRLRTVMDSDCIIVMDAGCVVEMDHPYHLLQSKSSLLYKMVQQTGPVMSASLFRLAQDSYQKKDNHFL